MNDKRLYDLQHSMIKVESMVKRARSNLKFSASVTELLDVSKLCAAMAKTLLEVGDVLLIDIQDNG